MNSKLLLPVIFRTKLDNQARIGFLAEMVFAEKILLPNLKWNFGYKWLFG
jgi:hypothetical protein